MKKKIVAVTEGRMTYGLLYWTLKSLEQNEDFELHIVATGSHLSKQHGMTIGVIEKENFQNLHRINSIVEGQEKKYIAKSMARVIESLSDIFEKIQPDAMMILGDRYELLAAANTATTMNIPIIHICGGEVSEGAIDEQIRHALTKLSHLHFTGCEEYRQNVIKLGENPSKVFNVGEPGLENIEKLNLLNKEILFKKLGINRSENKPLFLITYHPVTLESCGLEKIENFISALQEFDAIQIITAPNQDHEGNMFLEKLEDYASSKHNVHLFSSLGQLKYLSTMSFSNVVIGNSSSGIIETPSFKVPCVNIGNRQNGRLRSHNIIDSNDDKESIIIAINKALSKEFNDGINNIQSIFGDGKVSDKIIKKLSEINNFKDLIKKNLNWWQI